VITLLLKEVISIRFDQNLPQGENWPTEERIRQNTEEARTQNMSEEVGHQKWSLEFMWCYCSWLWGIMVTVRLCYN
jgi:hypothetical protein